VPLLTSLFLVSGPPFPEETWSLRAVGLGVILLWCEIIFLSLGSRSRSGVLINLQIFVVCSVAFMSYGRDEGVRGRET
jgi:hypothetical protein